MEAGEEKMSFCWPCNTVIQEPISYLTQPYSHDPSDPPPPMTYLLQWGITCDLLQQEQGLLSFALAALA